MTEFHVKVSCLDMNGNRSPAEILEWTAPGFTRASMTNIWECMKFNHDGANGSMTIALLSVNGQTVRAFRLKTRADRYHPSIQYYDLDTINLRPRAYFKPEILREGVWAE